MGGAAGHLSHIHDNVSLTFGEIKDILSDVASGNIDLIEKVDGQNIFFTWNPSAGEARFARNKGDIVKGGMNPGAYADKWAGHPAEVAFREGGVVIEDVLRNIPLSLRKQIFGNGNRYVNAELICSRLPVVINYGCDHIVLHNLQDMSGGQNEKQEDGGLFAKLVGSIKDPRGTNNSLGWRIHGPQSVSVKDVEIDDHLTKLFDSLDSLGMSDDATLADYIGEVLRGGVIGDLPIPINRQEAVIKQILRIGKLPGMRKLKAGLPKDVQKKISALATKANSDKVRKRVIKPVEDAINRFAIELLRGTKSALIGSERHASEIERIKAGVYDAIEQLESSGDQKIKDKLARQLEKLGDIEKNISSSMEGVVFNYPRGSENMYKLTGAYAQANQLIGRAKRLGESSTFRTKNTHIPFIPILTS